MAGLNTPTTTSTMEVRRDNLREARIVTGQIDPATVTEAGGSVLAIDQFALTANNITYAAFGDKMSYFDFFPVSEGFGCIPVWGFADVIASGAAALPVGERIYGYFPFASHLVVTPDRVSPRRFIDGSPHRAKLPAVYNAYERTAADPAYAKAHEAAQMILRPLVITSFLIADFLDDNKLFGARQVLISSASSKTSLGLAFCFKRMNVPGLSIIGLTSGGNRAFVEGFGLYDHVAAYESIGTLDAGTPSVYVDMAGSADALAAVHNQFEDNLKYSCRVGGTHWEGLAGRMDLPGARPQFFFAPSQVQKRNSDWGPGGLEQRFAGVWSEMVPWSERWLKVDVRRGPDAVRAAYIETLEGRQKPETGLVLSLAG